MLLKQALRQKKKREKENFQYSNRYITLPLTPELNKSFQIESIFLSTCPPLAKLNRSSKHQMVSRDTIKLTKYRRLPGISLAISACTVICLGWIDITRQGILILPLCNLYPHRDPWFSKILTSRTTPLEPRVRAGTHAHARTHLHTDFKVDSRSPLDTASGWSRSLSN